MPKSSSATQRSMTGPAAVPNAPAARGLFRAALLATLFAAAPAYPLSQEEIAAKVLSVMDNSASPCEDFYQYACGNWIREASIPADEVNVDRGIGTADDAIRARLAVLLQEGATNPGGNRALALAGTYFAACMDMAGRDGGQPNPAAVAALQPYLDLIDNVRNTKDFLYVAGKLAAIGVPAVFNLSLIPNVFVSPNSSNYMFRLDPADPGYYDGDIYRKSDARNRALRRDLGKIVTTILGRFGDTARASRHARDIIKLESLFARYHPYFGKQPGIVIAAPGYLYMAGPRQDWARFFDGAGVLPGELLFFSRGYMGALGNFLAQFPVDSLRSYLRWTLIRTYRFYLPHYYREFPPLSPAFAAQIPAGFSPAWKQCVDNTSAALAETTGKIWAESQSSDRIFATTSSMMNAVRNGFLARLPAVSWLDGASAAATANKAASTDLQLGVPGSWIDETGIPLSRDGHLANTIAANQFNFQRLASRVDQPVSRTIWDSDTSRQHAQTVNAAHLRLTNQIYIPLGIQQEPFIHPDYPLAMNYGGLGSILGHEFIHGYDDGGHYFDAQGFYRNIWSGATSRAFQARSQCLVRQYGRYRVSPPPVRLDGGAMLTENIADNGGIRLAFNAFQSSSPESLGNPSGVGGLTQGQLFFVAYAQNWCEKTTPERQAYLASRSWYNYAPNRYRVIGSLSNSSEFAASFGCPARSPMNPPRKCEVW